MTAPLVRIPFSARDEGRIDSASRWMRFIAIVQIVSSVIGLVVLILIGSVISLFGAEIMLKLREAADEANAKIEIDALLAAPLGVILIIVGLIALAAIGVQLWASMLLYRAGDSFAQVAATDVADQDFLAEGFGHLKTFFYVEAAFAVLAAVNAAVGLLGMGGAA